MAIRRLYFYADDQADADVLAWLAAQTNRSESLRALIRAAAPGPRAAIDEAQLRRVLREELARLAGPASAAAGPTASAAPEDDDLRHALDGLATTWQY